MVWSYLEESDLRTSEKEQVDLSWRNEKKYRNTKNHISRSNKKWYDN